MSGLLILMGIVGAGSELDFHWVDDSHHVQRWITQPSWLTHPSPTASVTADGQVACFRVEEAECGMKWSASMPGVWLEELPYDPGEVRTSARPLLRNELGSRGVEDEECTRLTVIE